ncbi:cadherin domain-containing protein [Gammaproteobacteria bacterium]|nr:cadherin domain-containing protein [Gammaproteobacteria bacterium]
MNKKLLPITFSILFIVSCGGGGGGGGGTPTTPTTPAPTVNLSAEPTSVLLENTSTLTWSSTNATSCSASWTTQTSTSGSEAVTISTVGNNSFSISCTGAGGTRSASVTVEGYRETDGVVVDGYISGAEVCIDEDESWTCDASENSTTSDNEGKFTIRYANGNLVSIGGTDLDSQTLLDNLLITHKLSGHSDFKAVTPVTSVAAFMEDASLVNAALGIDSSIDVFTFDPVANKGDGGIYDYLYEKGNQLTVLAFALQNITNNLNTTTETTQDYFKAITEEIEKEYTETETKVDIETEAFITKALENVIEAKSVTIDETAKANVAKALSGMLPIIQVKSSDDLTTGVIRFAVSTLQTDIQAIANGTATAETVSSYTEDLLNYIAEDQSIDSGEIAPDINAIADNVTTSEDTEVEINVLLNDSYVTSSPFSLSATNGTNGSTSISNNLITYSPDTDYNGSDSFSYTITQGDKTSSADVNITIEPVNDAPSINIASTIQVEENQTAVTTVSVSDVDEDELTLTLGGTDANSFNLSDDNVLTFKEAPDYETKDSYALTLSLTDGIETVTKDLSIIILDVNYVFSGKVIDGYINGAEIFIDQNFNLTKDDGEFSATSDSDGAFNIDISDESLAACLQKRPIIAEVPVGAIDSSLGEVSSAYNMILPSIEDSIDANAAIFITPFTSLLSDAVIQGINASNIVDEIDVSEGCGDLANSIAINISNELLQISGSIESSLDISFEDLLIDFIQDNSSSTITETSAQKLAAFFPYFKELSDEFDAELSSMHGEIINTNVIIEDDAISSILSSTDIEEIPLSFNAIYETDPNELGWFIQEKIIANGAKVNSDGQIKHYTCFTNSENCITDTRNLDALRNASKRYTRTSTFLNNTYNPENYNYQLVIEDEQRVDLDINGNPKDRVCIYQNWLYLTPVNTRENFVTNDRYNTGVSDGSNDNDDCSSVLANKNEALFVALVDKYDDGIDFEEIDIRITNPIYQNSTFFENKVNNIYQNRNNLDLDPLIQEIASVPRTFKDIENLRAKLTESSTDQISIFWTKRNAAGQQLESAKIDIKFDKSNDYFEYGTIENSSTGSEYTVVTSTEGQQAINDIVNILYSNSNVFNSPDYLSYAPIFTSESTFAVDENQTDIGTVTAVDGDDDPITFTISSDDISISAEGVLTFNTAPDFETKTSYTATVTASDGTNSTIQEITVNINNVNDVAPVITSVDSFSVEENQTVIGAVTATDAEGDDVTFSISGDELAITSAGVLTFVSAPDYETKATYSATVTASDGTNSTDQAIKVNVTNINDNSPVITSSNEYSIEENTTEVGQATATDADGDGIVFSITSDSDISIDSSSGVIYFNTAPDYETATSHSATITVSDGAFTSSQEITISVTDADEGPPQLTNLKITGLGPSDFINKSTSIEFTASDETDIVQVVLRLKNTDTNSFFQRTLNYPSSQTVNGSLTDTFFIDFNEQLRSGTYQISELALYDSLDKSINAILDTEFINSFDVNNSNQETIVPELLAYTLTVSENTLIIHSLIKEEDSGISKLYQVDSDSRYSSTQELLNEAYNLNIHASDTAVEYVGGGVAVEDLTDNEDGTYNTVTRLTMSSNADAEAAEIIKYEIHDRAFNRVEYLPNSNNLVPVANANPIFISDSTFSVDENETGIGTASARNAKGDALTYSVSGSEVIINETSGVMVFASAPDYESKSTYTVTVTATDGTNSSTQEITININDVREQTIQVSVEANNNGSGNVYVINGTQRPNLDLVKGVTYTFVHPTGHPFRFSTTADGTHGGGTEYTTGVNTGSSGTTIIKVTDNTPEGLYYYCSIHSGMGNGINLIDNAPPEFTSSATFSADENQTAIGTVTATDAESDAITYSISGSDIEITSAGVLSFVSAPDYETKSSYTATITANDGTSSSTQDITVNINNLNDNNPSFTSNATFSAAENQTAIGTVTATDADGDSVTYTVSGAELSITSEGILSFTSAPDYETKTSYSASVTASDGTNSTTQDITVNVTNVNDIAPEFTSDATFSAPENQTAIGTVTATDADGDDVTFTVSGSELAITSAGVLTFVSAPDYETKSSYTTTVTASDGTNSTTQDITVNVTNVNDNSPAFTSNATFSAEENQTAIGTVTATDADGDGVTFTVSGSELAITSAGVLTFAETPDYETKTSYTTTVTASDGTNSTTQDITVNVTNVNDNSPAFTSNATFSADDNQTSIGTVTATDADGDTITYSISGTDSESVSINSSSGVLTFNSAPNYESKTSYSIVASASDGVNETNQNITITINNINEAPAFTSSASFSADENQTSIGTVTVTDVDGDDVTFSISGDELEITSAGVLTFVSAPDYETKTSYTATVTASDGTNTTTQDITVNVIDANDAPAFTSASAFSADEQQLSIGTVAASDQDGDALSFSMKSGNDLSIDANSGVLTFNTAPDYETTTSITDIVKVTDGSVETTQSITVSINETQFEVYGVAYASKYIEVDRDIPNTDYLANDNSNNFVSSAPTITNPALIAGFTGHSGDSGDLYKISTSSNMYVNLDVVDYENGSKDLDLSIWNEDGTSRSYTYVSGSTEANETINLPSSGTYLIYVSPFEGSSKYYLTVGQRLTEQSINTSASTSADYVKNEIISYIPFTTKETITSSTKDADPKMISSAVTPLSNETTPGLRKLKPVNLISSFKNKLSNSNNTELVYSQKQINYLSHWKAKERLRDLNPLANYSLNYYVNKMEAFSADPYYGVQWNLRQINLESALNAIGQEVKDIAVAVVDTGSPSVNSTAWNSSNFISGGYDFVQSASNGDGDGIDNDPTDPTSANLGQSHGTHVATTIGLKNDGSDLNGMAIKVLPLRVFPSAKDARATNYDINQAILYAAGLTNDSGTVAPTTTPIKVINLSLGGYGGYDCSIFSDVVAQGITVVAASGNEGNEDRAGQYSYPASCSNVISVSSTNSYDQRAIYSQFNNQVDIAAPGGSLGIDADADGYADGVWAYSNDSNIEALQGTSMASPTVAGGIALLYSIDNEMTPAKINSFIQNGYITDDIGTSGYDISFGYGRLNMAKAVENTLSNIGNTTVTYMYTSESFVDFGNSLTQVNITLNKVGGSALSVTSLSADDATGLSYTSNVDSEGVGTYTIYMDRGSIPDGEFQNRLYFNLSNSTKVSIGAYYRVGAEKTRPNIGKAYVGLYNDSDEAVAAGELDFNGSLSFVANDIVDGNYYFIVSTDNDDDNTICGYGELCQYYPEYGSSPSTFSVSGKDTSGAVIDIKPNFKYGGINAASTQNKAPINLNNSIKKLKSQKEIIQLEFIDIGENFNDDSSRIPINAIPFNSN